MVQNVSLYTHWKNLDLFSAKKYIDPLEDQTCILVLWQLFAPENQLWFYTLTHMIYV